MTPADQRLGADDVTFRNRDDRLVVQEELVALERMPQVALDLQPRQRLGVHRAIEHLVSSATGVLGAVHRDVGAAQDVFRLFTGAGAQRHANARGCCVLVAADRERYLQRFLDAFGDHGRVAHVDDPLQQDRELVTTQPRHDVAAAYTGFETARDGYEHFVADVMAHRVVDQLEAIDVEEEDGEQSVLSAARAMRGVRQPPHEERSVGQVGQRVVHRLVPQALLALLAIGKSLAQPQLGSGHFAIRREQRHFISRPLPRHVVDHADHAGDAAVLTQECRGRHADNAQFNRGIAKRDVAIHCVKVGKRQRPAVVNCALQEARADQRARIVREPVAMQVPRAKAATIIAKESDECRRGSNGLRNHAYEAFH